MSQIIDIKGRKFTVAPFSFYDLRTDDPEGVAVMLRGVLSTDAIVTSYPDHGEVFVKVYEDRDEIMLRTAASDLIKEETHYLGDERPHDEDTGSICFKHRVNGPAKVYRSHKGMVSEDHFLWESPLRPEDHAAAIKKGLHLDYEAFKPWWGKRLQTLRRKGLA